MSEGNRPLFTRGELDYLNEVVYSYLDYFGRYPTIQLLRGSRYEVCGVEFPNAIVLQAEGNENESDLTYVDFRLSTVGLVCDVALAIHTQLFRRVLVTPVAPCQKEVL